MAAVASRIPRLAIASSRSLSSSAFSNAQASSSSSTATASPSPATSIPVEAQLPPTNSRIGVVPPPIEGPKLTGWKRSLLLKSASLVGYHPTKQAAVRSTNAYYNVTSEQSERDAAFWFDECGLPRSFQTWFQITNLHLYLLTARFRALPSPLGPSFNQQLVNQFFIDAEFRMASPKFYNIKKAGSVKKSMQDFSAQHFGAIMAFDEALIKGDAVLAAALWRNCFGAGWGSGLGGVLKTSLPGKDDGPKLDSAAIPPPPSTEDSTPVQILSPQEIVERETKFAANLERLTRWFRMEVNRLDRLTDDSVIFARSQGELGRASDWTPI